MSPVLALHKYTLLSKATASTFPELQSTRFRSAGGGREEHEPPCLPWPSLPHFLQPPDEEAALTVVIPDFRGVQDAVWQGRDVTAGLPAGARRGLLAIEYF